MHTQHPSVDKSTEREVIKHLHGRAKRRIDESRLHLSLCGLTGVQNRKERVVVTTCKCAWMRQRGLSQKRTSTQ